MCMFVCLSVSDVRCVFVALVLRKEVAQSIQAHTRAKGEIKLVALQVLDALEYFLPVCIL